MSIDVQSSVVAVGNLNISQEFSFAPLPLYIDEIRVGSKNKLNSIACIKIYDSYRKQQKGRFIEGEDAYCTGDCTIANCKSCVKCGDKSFCNTCEPSFTYLENGKYI